MSGSLQPSPGHFTQHAFTSTLHDRKHHLLGFNVYIVLMTALVFFSILAWFNFVLAWYGTWISTDPDHVDQTLSTLGFALIWTGISILLYYVMKYTGVLGLLTEEEGHPLLKGDRIDVSGDIASDVGRVPDISTDVLGSVDMAAV